MQIRAKSSSHYWILARKPRSSPDLTKNYQTFTGILMNLNRSRNSAFSHGFCRLDRIYRVLMKKTSNPTHLSRFLVAETYLRPSWASGQPVFELDRAVWAGGLVLGFPWTSLPNNNHNPVTTQFQGHCLDSNANHNHVVTTQALAFTPDQYQQLLSFIGVHQTSTEIGRASCRERVCYAV